MNRSGRTLRVRQRTAPRLVTPDSRKWTFAPSSSCPPSRARSSSGSSSSSSLSHYYLTVLEGTATGAKEVTWYSEPIIDNFWKLWYMLWLFGLWFGPALPRRQGDLGGHGLGVADARGFRLRSCGCFTPSVNCRRSRPARSGCRLCRTSSRDWPRSRRSRSVSTSSRSRCSRFLRLAFKWAFLTKGEWELLFVGAPLMVLAMFLYARLIGRLAFVLAFTKSLFRERKKKKPKSAVEGGKPTAEDKEEVAPTIAQPRDLPPLRTARGGTDRLRRGVRGRGAAQARRGRGRR